MSIWNRLQNLHSLKKGNRSELLLQVVIVNGFMWGLEKWGFFEKWDPPPKEKEKPFKELHQPRSLSDSKDDDAPNELP